MTLVSCRSSAASASSLTRFAAVVYRTLRPASAIAVPIPMSRCDLPVNRSETRFQLRSLLILIDQPVHNLPASHPDRGQIGDRRRKGVAVGWALPTALMRPVSVVMRQILAQHSE